MAAAATASSFRADDILRSKLSVDENLSHPGINSPPPKIDFEKETPASRPSYLPQIRPPAFSPVVNLKHITPFEHSEKPVFRSRLSSLPPPRASSKPARPNWSSPSALPVNQEKIPQQSRPSKTQVYNSPNIYSWDSWERPVFSRAPGCLSLQTLDRVLMNDHQLRSPSMPPSQPVMPPPMLYYDPYSGQYLPVLDYTSKRRYSQSLGRRHPSRSHSHQSRKSVGMYSTYDRNRSSSSMFTYTPEPLIERHVTVTVQPRPESQLQTGNSRQYLQPTPQTSTKLRQDYRYEDEMQMSPRRQLVSRGTDDTPVDSFSPSIESKINPVNGRVVEAITPVYIPPTMEVRRPENNIKSPPENTPIRYTSDVVRSLNRQAFKMGRRNSSEGPRDHYLQVINKSTHPVASEKTALSNGKLSSCEKRPSVADLVKKFQQPLQQEEEVYTPQTNYYRAPVNSQLPIGDSIEISGDVSSTDDLYKN